LTLVVRLHAMQEPAPPVRFRWDTDTDILTARLESPERTGGAVATVELEGSDGAWLTLDLRDGRLEGVAVAVWPEVRMRAGLVPPVPVQESLLTLAEGVAGADGVVELDTPVRAESNPAEDVIYFRVGASRVERTVRVGGGLLVDLDAAQRIAGLWFLDVPPFPSTPQAP
jgi:uncharacterized protein YuzE